MSEKTAIESLYRILRERDVECETYELPDEDMAVSWEGDHDIEWEATAQGENFAIHALQLVTPEQAIAATVGAGTCKMRKVVDNSITSLRCSECGHETFYEYQLNNGNEFFAYPYPKFCPNCGRRIEVGE